MLQCTVLLGNQSQTTISALASIGVSALTTGFASALITFDVEISVDERKNQPLFFGFIPDDHAARGKAFVLMMLISAFHNLSRSVGCALLALASGKTVAFFVGGEMLVFWTWKILRGDFLYWARIEWPLIIIVTLVDRVTQKIVADFSGCLLYRHPCAMGGIAFSVNMIWVSINETLKKK